MIRSLVPNNNLRCLLIQHKGLVRAASSFEKSEGPLVRELAVFIGVHDRREHFERVGVRRHVSSLLSALQQFGIFAILIWITLRNHVITLRLLILLPGILLLLLPLLIRLLPPVDLLDIPLVIRHFPQTHQPANTDRLVINGVVGHDVQVVGLVIREGRRNIEDIRFVYAKNIALMQERPIVL